MNDTKSIVNDTDGSVNKAHNSENKGFLRHRVLKSKCRIDDFTVLLFSKDHELIQDYQNVFGNERITLVVAYESDVVNKLIITHKPDLLLVNYDLYDDLDIVSLCFDSSYLPVLFITSSLEISDPKRRTVYRGFDGCIPHGIKTRMAMRKIIRYCYIGRLGKVVSKLEDDINNKLSVMLKKLKLKGE